MARPSTLVKVPRERIGALIGLDGRVKENVEKKLSVELQIDSQTGNVTITLSPTAEDPSVLFRAKEVIIAIGRGFSPERAFKLLHDNTAVLKIIDLREIVGKSPSELKRLKGRIIGREGKTRKIMEELTDASISIRGHTVSIIGNADQTEVANEAIQLLIRGSQHRTVYGFLHRKRRDLKKQRMELWETPPEKLDVQ